MVHYVIQGLAFENDILFISKIDLILANIADPDEMLHSSHLGLHCFVKIPINGFLVKSGVKGITFEQVSSKRYKLTCAPIEDSDQPAQLCSLI